MLLVGLFYILVPLLFIGVIAFQRQVNVLNWFLTVLALGSVIVYMWVSARWEIVSIYWRTLFPILYLIACVIGFRRIKEPVKKPGKLGVILSISINVLLIIFMSGLNWFAFQGYSMPDDTIDLASPLRHGRYVVLHGGSSPFINGHARIRPQNYALDIVGLNKLGMRANSFAGGPDLSQYAIYGDTVFCPCAGTILLAIDEYEDLIPPKRDTEHLAGNHVLLECNGMEVLLAHLKSGSITVKAGDEVTTDTVLGLVGNTGNTSEPHLHIHVEQGGEPDKILNGNAVAFTINNRFLLRGNVIND